jgi:hypothetical protein
LKEGTLRKKGKLNMRITIDLHMIINGTRTLTRGDWQVKKQEEIPKVAHNWIRRIRRETGYYGEESIIEKVIVDGNQDITDKVREIDKAPLK